MYYEKPMDNLFSKQSRSLYKVPKTYTSCTFIKWGRRAAIEFFDMYDNLPYGQVIGDALDEEDLLTIPPLCFVQTPILYANVNPWV
jgi:hypothetical protein